MSIDPDSTYRRYAPMVLRRCRQLLKDEEAAVDAMQDVFVQIVQHQARLEDHGLSSLLYRIATNTCLNRLRSRRRKPETRDEELLHRIADAAPAHDDRVLARSFLATLFGREREGTGTIAVLHHVDGMTLEEVAAAVGMSVSGVRKRLRTLQASLPDLTGDGE